MQDVDRDRLRKALRSASEALDGVAEAAGLQEPASLPPLMAARRLSEQRRSRDDHFSAGLFGDPAWDIMLALFIAVETGNRMNVSRTWEAGGIGSATGGRLLAKLEKSGMIRRDRSPDRKQQYVELTDTAHQQMLDYLASLG